MIDDYFAKVTNNIKKQSKMLRFLLIYDDFEI